MNDMRNREEPFENDKSYAQTTVHSEKDSITIAVSITDTTICYNNRDVMQNQSKMRGIHSK